MPKGHVKWFSTEKGFGFIEQDSGDDIFMHHSEVQSDDLNPADAVEYEIGEGRKGPCATNVRKV